MAQLSFPWGRGNSIRFRARLQSAATRTKKLIRDAVRLTVRIVSFLSYPPTQAAFKDYGLRLKPSIVYLFSSEIYTLASAISTNAILSFFPFAILILSFVRHVLHSTAAHEAIVEFLRDYLPFQQAFIIKSLETMTDKIGSIQFISVVVLILSATGVFIPLEVTLNRTWQARANMGVIKNQIVSFGLALICGVLALLSAYITGLNVSIIRFLLGWTPFPKITNALSFIVLKLVGFSVATAIFFSVYYLLPNIRLSLNKTIRASIFTGVTWELSKYVYIWSLPYLELDSLYGPFTASVVLIIWCYVSALIMILGADLAHRDLLSMEWLRAAHEGWRRAQENLSSPELEPSIGHS